MTLASPINNLVSSVFLPISLSPATISAAEAAVAPRREEDATWPICSGSTAPNSVRPEPRILVTEDDPPMSAPNKRPPKAAVPNAGSQGGSEDVGWEEAEEEEEVAVVAFGVDLSREAGRWRGEEGWTYATQPIYSSANNNNNSSSSHNKLFINPRYLSHYFDLAAGI